MGKYREKLYSKFLFLADKVEPAQLTLIDFAVHMVFTLFYLIYISIIDFHFYWHMMLIATAILDTAVQSLFGGRISIHLSSIS